MDEVDLVIEALEQIGFQGRDVALTATRQTGHGDDGYDLVVDPSGVAVRLEIHRRSLVTDDVASRLVTQASRLPSDTVLLVVGDRVTEPARTLLLDHGGGYLDLRGRIALRTKRMVIDAPIEPVNERSRRTDPLAGKVGLEVAVTLLMEPTRRPGVRQLATELKRSASTVSEVLSAMREDGLLGAGAEGPGDQLFWAVADRWPSKRTYLASAPNPGMRWEPDLDEIPSKTLRLGLEHVEDQEGWALTDNRAAAIYGAPIAARAHQLLDFYVPDATVVRRATTLLGSAPIREAQVAVRVAPVPVVCRQRVDDVESFRAPDNHWPLAHPLFVALDLAQDAGRGRDILRDWEPDPRWHRVW